MRARVSLVVLALLVGGCSNSASNSASNRSTSTSVNANVAAPAPEGIDGVVAIPAADAKTDQAHVAGKVTYATVPPTRGPHNALWQNCGFYTKAVIDENAVHSLEHGAVWITYTEAADAAARNKLAALAKANRYVLVTPYPANPAPFVLSAWGRQLKVDSIDDLRVARFIDIYAQDGPTVPEVGAACSGALGVAPDRPATLAS